MSAHVEPLGVAGGRITVPGHLMAGSGEHFVLRVAGDSLIEEGICDGDFVICQRTENPGPGELAVCEVGSETTLKYFYREGSQVRLEPANPCLRAIHLPAHEVKVTAVAVGLMRRFTARPAREARS